MLDNLDIRFVAWSPTVGNHLAFTTTAGVYVLDVHSGAFSNLIYGRGVITTVLWSPDGRHIAAYIFGYPWVPDAQIAIAEIRSGEVYLISTRTWNRGILDWAPGGAEFVYSTGQGGQSDVWRVALPVSHEGD
jgi:Tol biopolymer transport system component